MKVRLSAALAAVVLLCAGAWSDAQACNVPAFRYALERWPADPYPVFVYYQARPGEAFQLLQKGAAAGRGANYSLTGVDVATPAGKALAEERNITAYPWVEIFYPDRSRIRTPVWSGPLTSDLARKILGSPVRSSLAQKLLRGDVAVWVLVKSGREEEDRRALQLLRSQLEWAAANLRIPQIGTDLNGNPVEVAEFKAYPVRFAVMEIARNDPNEGILLNALLKSEPDLDRYDAPMAFPVFGRGRALYALVGDGIQEKNVREACRSMMAWCSCEIKAMNPGTDLPIAADWSSPYGGRMVKDPDLPLTGLSGFRPDPGTPAALAPSPVSKGSPQGAVCAVVPLASRTGDTHPGGVAAQPHSSLDPLTRNVLYLAGGGGLLILALSVIVSVKAKKQRDFDVTGPHVPGSGGR